MLKIKDRVSLTELEKFGFENGSKSYLLICDGEILCVDKQYRNIFIQCENMWNIAEDSFGLIYDLIKADLVEKVEND